MEKIKLKNKNVILKPSYKSWKREKVDSETISHLPERERGRVDCGGTNSSFNPHLHPCFNKHEKHMFFSHFAYFKTI